MIQPSTPEETGRNERPKLRAVAEALGLTAASIVGGIAAVMLISAAFVASGLPSTDAVQLLRSRAIQVGFLAVALGYLAVRGQPSPPIQFRVPLLHDAAWIVAIPLLTVGAGFVLEPLLSAVGIAPPAGAGAMAIDDFLSRPLLWLVVLVGWFGFAAPAEELLFRGIVQGRLRERFAPALGVLLAAACFALMHVPIAALSTGMAPAYSLFETFVGGAVFGIAYERTDNLLVPSVAHAGLWASGLLI